MRFHVRQPSNVRCYLPKAEAAKLLSVIEQISRSGQLREVSRNANKTDAYDATDDFAKSIDEAYRVIRERMRNGGPGWQQGKWPK